MPTRKRRAKKLNLPIDQLPDGRGKHGKQKRGIQHYKQQAEQDEFFEELECKREEGLTIQEDYN